MDRVSGMTSQAFIEFVTVKDAEKAIAKMYQTQDPKLGGWPVYCRLSNEETLMTALFPTAKNVSWNNGEPTLLPTNKAFMGFIGVEEMETLAKHVEAGVSTFLLLTTSAIHMLIGTSHSLAT